MLTLILILLVVGMGYLIYRGVSWERIVLFLTALGAAVASLDWAALVSLFS